MSSDDGPSFDYVFDPKIPFDNEEVAMLSMQIAMHIQEYLNNNPDDAKILYSESENETGYKSQIKKKIKNYVLDKYKKYLDNLSKSIKDKTESISEAAESNSQIILGIFNKVLEESLKIVEDVGSQEGEKGIGWWSIGKTTLSSFTYYGRRIRGDSKFEALSKQLEDWERDHNVEKAVRTAIADEFVYDTIAKNNRLSHWDRRILFKTQKVTEKKKAVRLEKEVMRKKEKANLRDEIKK